ncbi:MAG: isocitrate lyase/PEP mutase family protein [Gammaproteobacteria bacterium]|nr:isocitrate lyase/PEP mutase family protein [Gammaproteobacteria bacterium]
MNNKKLTLANLLRNQKIVVAPGCHDALGAKIIETAGFNVVYMTGNGVSASSIGKPDIGLVSMSEMIVRARGIASAVNIPVICDADTGYGNINNVMRTVKEYEAAGVSAIHIEDQITPKMCGAMAGLKLVSTEEYIAKIKAATVARNSADFLIIARTDARAVLGFDEAIRRGQLAFEAGADVVYIELLESVDEMKQAIKNINAPMMFDMLENFSMPLDIDTLEKIGYKLVIFPMSSTLLYAKTTLKLMNSLKKNGNTVEFLADMMTLHEYESILGLDEIREREKKLTSSID